MVKITNGSRTTVVTKGVFEEMYKSSGWEICDISNEVSQNEEILNPEENAPESTPEILPAQTEDELLTPEDVPDEDEEVEIPISEMKLDELKAYAAKHDIDISAAKTKQDIKAIIKAEMEG